MEPYFCIAFIINIGIIGFLIDFFAQKLNGKSNRFFQIPLTITPAWFGVRLGLILSLCLSITYAFLGVFVIETFVEPTFVDPSAGNFLSVWALGSPLIFLLAILPAVIIGVLTGTVLSVLISQVRQWSSMKITVFLGLAVCVVMVVLLHIILRDEVNFFADVISFGAYGKYPFLLGIPSIIYLIAGGWASYYIYKRLEVPQEGS